MPRAAPRPRKPPRRAAPPRKPAAAAAPAAANDNGKLAPSVRRMVEEKQLDPAKIPATGRDGRITKGDVVEYLDKPAAKAAGGDKPLLPSAAPVAAVGAAGRQDQRVPMTRLRARIAERLLEAQHTQAQLTTFNEIDLKAVMDVRAKYKDGFEKKHGVKLGFMSFFVKAAVEALKKFPMVNASIEGNDIVYHEYYDIGVAVSTEKGLMVPVLRDVGSAELRRHREEHRRVRGEGARRQDHASKSSPAARSPSPTAAPSVRCCRRPSSTCRRARSSACTRPRNARWWSTARSRSAR